MSLRIFSVALMLGVAGCGAASEDKVAQIAQENRVASRPDDDGRIDCAVGGATAFTRTCAVEKTAGTLLILRHADGGFRRVDLAADGTLSAADGSDEAEGKPLPDGRFELTLGRDRYRLPPAIK
jgi:hypothetical protein